MKEQTMSDELLRQFLLDNVNDEERARIESLFLTDSLVKERVLAAEQNLIEDYLEDSLTTVDRERFLSRYAQTTAQRRKLRITKSIKDWAVTEATGTQAEAAVSQTVPSTISIWSRAGAWLRHRPTFVVPLAVATMVAIIVAAVWLNSRTEQRNRQRIEQELAQLNTPASLREVPPQMLSKELSPVTVRNVEQQAEIKRSADIRIVELRLPWVQRERYSTYEAEVRRVSGDESLTIRNLQADGDGGYFIRIRLRATILNRGHYQILLRGIAADGATSPIQEYSFVVSD
jgi:hypothetical protein